MTHNLNSVCIMKNHLQVNAFYLLIIFIGEFLGHPILPRNR